MTQRIRRAWRNATANLAVIPGLIVIGFGLLAIALVHIDETNDLSDAGFLFEGDGPAARTLLSVVAGSLITVAGLTFSITMVVLQLASSQFSPRVLRGFFGDRLTQATVGTFVGIFVFALLVLRAVGDLDQNTFVPRLSVSVASLLAIAAVVLLVVFLHHVSQLVQVSHVTATIARETLSRIDRLYPDPYGDPVDDGGAEHLARWREVEPGRLGPDRPGFVQSVAAEQLADAVAGRAERVAVLVCPGDFVGVETALAEVWPPEALEECAEAIHDAIALASERDLHQDSDFGARQLADMTLRAVSPAMNDPMTAATCIGYLRSVLVRLTERSDPDDVREFEDGLVMVLRRRTYAEHLECIAQIHRSTAGDAWVVAELMRTLLACAQAARRVGALDRLDIVTDLAASLAQVSLREIPAERDRRAIEDVAGQIAAA